MMQYGVQGIPTMIFVHDGKLIHRQVGALPEPVLRDLFEQFINIANEQKASEN
jgi:thioredoxin 1